jgi:hypothetical protein
VKLLKHFKGSQTRKVLESLLRVFTKTNRKDEL